MHAVQSPHRSGWGSSAASSASVTSAPSKSQEPSFSWMRQPFLPIQPIPASCAHAFSSTAPASTSQYTRAPSEERKKAASLRAGFRTTLW